MKVWNYENVLIENIGLVHWGENSISFEIKFDMDLLKMFIGVMEEQKRIIVMKFCIVQ